MDVNYGFHKCDTHPPYFKLSAFYASPCPHTDLKHGVVVVAFGAGSLGYPVGERDQPPAPRNAVVIRCWSEMIATYVVINAIEYA